MIDSITKSEGKQDLNTLTFYFIILTLVSAVFTFVRAYSYNILGEKITFDLRNELF